mmetsp:Transcript_17528/g.50141  ORF Transcript_17528/g.50141 Transcript_17528/m.50141 type:complete len:213 (+) Transcript_17528:318-956(+)
MSGRNCKAGKQTCGWMPRMRSFCLRRPTRGICSRDQCQSKWISRTLATYVASRSAISSSRAAVCSIGPWTGRSIARSQSRRFSLWRSIARVSRSTCTARASSPSFRCLRCLGATVMGVRGGFKLSWMTQSCWRGLKRSRQLGSTTWSTLRLRPSHRSWTCGLLKRTIPESHGSARSRLVRAGHCRVGRARICANRVAILSQARAHRQCGAQT